MRNIVIVALLSFVSVVLASPQTDEKIELRELAPGVWMHTSYYTYPNGVQFPSNGLIVKERDGLILIDTAWGELKTIALLDAIESEIKIPVVKALVTHSHGDRLAGSDVLKLRGIPVMSHPLTKKLALEYGIPVPDQSIEALSEERAVIEIGKVQVFYPGAAHSTDNIMVWLPEENILFGGCAVRALSATSAGNTAHGDIESWLKVMNYVNERYKSINIVVPGHGEPGGRNLLSHTTKLVTEARR